MSHSVTAYGPGHYEVVDFWQAPCTMFIACLRNLWKCLNSVLKF